MSIEWVVVLALLLDFLLGDPRWLPHPVRAMGRCARHLESLSRRYIPSAFYAGLVTALVVYALVFFIPFFLLRAAHTLNPWLEAALSIFFIYTTIAVRDLVNHSLAVYRALKEPDLIEARRQVSRIVARDTHNLSRSEIIRACIESVAESVVDGVTAPLFFAIFGGPAWAMLYRSINTLDSLFGYRNEKYQRFGTVSARADDVANFIPARLTSPLVFAASIVLGLRPLQALRVLWRDGHKHPSPNSGLTEAAMAGAMGIQLGGVNYYNGIESRKPFLGDNQNPLEPEHILRATALMVVTSILTAALYILLRRLIT